MCVVPFFFFFRNTGEQKEYVLAEMEREKEGRQYNITNEATTKRIRMG